MCGRYGLTASRDELHKRYPIQETDVDFEEREEIFPTDENIVLLPNYRLYRIKWGFTPSFAKRPLINARSESVLEKPTFKEPFTKKRCLVPATLFYEWKKIKGQKKKEKKTISVKDLPIFSMAGICERYPDVNGGSYLTYSILTTDANPQMADIHDRMPVILDPEEETHYLDLSANPREIQQILKPTEQELVIN